MKFVKGIVVGGLLTTGILMMYGDNNMINKKRIIKKGKQLVKKIGNF